MAVIRKKSQDILLKELSGRVGDIIIRHRNGKTYISARSKKYKKSRTPKNIYVRGRFKIISKFASFLYRIQLLSAIWKKAEKEGEFAYQKMCGHNLDKCEGTNLSVNNIITPPHHHFRIRDIIIFDNNFEIIMGDWFQPEENDKIILIMALLEPKGQVIDEFQLMDISPGGEDAFEITLTREQLMQCARYKRFIIYAAVSRQSENDIKWSNTFAVEGDVDQSV